ncbi:MAG: DNA-processing protein DprA [Dehalococcoidia bacterium]
MISTAPSRDSLAIIMLRSELALPRGGHQRLRPLHAAEWGRVVAHLKQSGLKRPGVLLGKSSHEVQAALEIEPSLADHLAALLDRAGQLAIEIDRLAAQGIWISTRFEETYPTRLAQRLRGRTPAVLFGAGPWRVLNQEGVAVVGSRDLDEAGGAFARELGRLCAAAGVTVISGAARGADREAMTAALSSSGCAVGVLADSLETGIRDRSIGQAIRDDVLTLITPHHPSTRFNVGLAMARNKLVYCLSEAAVVVASKPEQGGTWTGAVENLRERWVPLFVRSGTNAPSGNHELIARGGIPLTAEALPTAGTLLADLLRSATASLDESQAIGSEVASASTHNNGAMEAANEQGRAALLGPPPGDLFEIVWPHLASYITEPRSERDIAKRFRLETSQARSWLARAVSDGKATRIQRPTRYQAIGFPGAAGQGILL